MAENKISIEEKTQGQVLIISLAGRLDAVNSPEAEEFVLNKIEEGSRFLLLDFAQVDYLSSAGMRMLLASTKKIKSRTGKLIVVSVQDAVLDVLRMSGFDHVLEIVDTIEDGLQKLS